MSNIIFKKLLWDYISENKWKMIQLLIVVLLTLPVEAVILPQVYGKLFFYINNSNTPMVITTLKVIIGIWVLVVIFISIKTDFEVDIAPDYLSSVRRTIFESTMKRHRKDYQDIRVGEHITRILDISRMMRDALLWLISEALPLVLAIVCIIIYMFTISCNIGATMFIGFSITMGVTCYFGNKCILQSSKRESFYLMMSEKLNDSFGNLMNIYLNNSDNEEIDKNNDLEKKHTILYKIQNRAGRNTIIALCSLSVITFGIAAFFMYKKWVAGQLSTPLFTGTWIVLLYYLSCLIRICHAMPLLMTQVGILHNSKEFLKDILNYKEINNSNVTNVIKKGSVIFENITFQYPGTSKPILTNFNLDIKENEKVGIIGTSGSGKTTIMKLLVGMYALASKGNTGQIYIDNMPIDTIDIRHLRAKVNYVNQRTQLFNMTILKNIQYGNPRLKESTVKELLLKYNLDTVFSKLKYGINTTVGVSGGNVSLGMQKIVILLRGLFKPAKIVVLDEPLAGLDTTTRTKILKCIIDMCDNKTLIVITHDPEIIPFMDRIVNLNKPLPVLPISDANGHQTTTRFNRVPLSGE